MSGKMFLTMLAFCAGIACLPGPARAQDGAWRVAEASGVVRVREPGQTPRQAALQEALRFGTVITTGAESSAVLENGLQRMTMAANSRLTIAAGNTPAMARILQDIGSVFFEVDRRRVQHFRVETPRLAAVVKGTTFTVTVAGSSDVVAVANGTVEVQANEGGALHAAAAGESVRVLAAEPARLVIGRLATSDTSSSTEAGAPLQLRGPVIAERSGETASLAAGASSSEASSGVRAQGQGGAALSSARPSPAPQTDVDRLGLFGFTMLFLLGAFAAGFGFFVAVQLFKWLGQTLTGGREKKKQRDGAGDDYFEPRRSY